MVGGFFLFIGLCKGLRLRLIFFSGEKNKKELVEIEKVALAWKSEGPDLKKSHLILSLRKVSPRSKKSHDWEKELGEKIKNGDQKVATQPKSTKILILHTPPT